MVMCESIALPTIMLLWLFYTISLTIIKLGLLVVYLHFFSYSLILFHIHQVFYFP